MMAFNASDLSPVRAKFYWRNGWWTIRSMNVLVIYLPQFLVFYFIFGDWSTVFFTHSCATKLLGIFCQKNTTQSLPSPHTQMHTTTVWVINES